MSARKSILASLLLLYTLLGGLALTDSPASAAAIHSYLSQITEVPAGPGVSAPGPFGNIESVTIDSGHLWVAERNVFPSRFNASSRADEFDAPTGAFISQFVPPAPLNFRPEGGGIAVGHSTGEARIYAGAANASFESTVAVFDEAGALQTTWTGASTPAGSFGSGNIKVAVDNSTSLSDPAAGDVYVAVGEQKAIDVFHPESDGKEHYVGQITGESFIYISKIAVNESNGDVIVLDGVGGRALKTVDIFEPTSLGGYTLIREITGISPDTPFSGTSAIAVDSGTGEIYVTEESGEGTATGSPTTVIDEFNSAGAYLGRITGDDSPDGNIFGVYSLAIDPKSHDVYIADSGNDGNGEDRRPAAIKVFGPDIVIPDVTTGSAANLTARNAILTGTVDPDKAGAATCKFVWGTSTEFGHTAPCAAAVAEGENPVLMEAQLSGLEPDTTYYYLLQATDAHGTNAGEPFQVQHFTTPGPKLEEEAVSAVTADSVTFDATIDPHNARTSYYIQYGITTGYGTNVPGPPGEELGSGKVGVESSQHVQHLSADTLYHYRVVAVSEVEAGTTVEFDGPDQTFTTQRSVSELRLPDGRMYEMVTPPAKEGALILGPNWAHLNSGSEALTGQAAADGSAIMDLASRPTEAGPLGNAMEVAVLSTRGSSGWSSQVIAPPHEKATFISISNGGEYRFLSEDLSQAIVQPFGPFIRLASSATESTSYLHTNFVPGHPTAYCQSSCFQPLVTASNTPAGTVFGEALPSGACPREFCGPDFLDATPDLSHVIVSSPAQLTSASAPEGGLYEWTGGRLQLISAPPEGQTGILRLAGSETINTIPTTQAAPGERDARHAISNNGERVILAGGGGLYLRHLTTGELIRLDVPQGGAATSKSPSYMTASTDASRIFFLDNAGLTPESSAAGMDLYEYDLDAPAGHRLTDLTVDQHGEEAADVEAVIGASNDGSYVYFVAAGTLAPGASPGDCIPYSGNPLPENREDCNIYVRHDDSTQLVAGDWNALPSMEGAEGSGSARVSPDGHWLAFMSSRDLTGYDTRDSINGRPDQQVYLYDADAGKLVCPACNPTGARPVGTETTAFNLAGGSLPDHTWTASNVPPLTIMEAASLGGGSRHQPRYLSDTGRLFFDSNDALVPQDVNGTEDVYEYEPPGVGSCTASSVTFAVRSGGCVNLISSGSSAEESAFVDASETGGDAFFITYSKLLPQDFDNAPDVYDAHECTANVPCYPMPPAVPPVCATGDACKAAPTPQPSLFGPAPSATFSGVGNVSPPSPGGGVRVKSLTRAQKLERALRECRKRSRKQRATCRRAERKRFGPVAGSHKASAKRKGKG